MLAELALAMLLGGAGGARLAAVLPVIPRVVSAPPRTPRPVLRRGPVITPGTPRPPRPRVPRG